MKTNELTDAILDYWVARAEGLVAMLDDEAQCRITTTTKGDRFWDEYKPSTDWAQGGPIIERQRILVWPVRQIDYNNPPILSWCSRCSAAPDRSMFAGMPLIAAMRAYIACKFGDEVPDLPI